MRGDALRMRVTMPRVDYGLPSDDAETSTLHGIQRRAFLGAPTPESTAQFLEVPPADLRVLRVKGQVAGGLVLIRMGQWFGGREVPMTGIAGVGVSPEHRTSGVGSSLVRAMLHDLHTEGTPISVLYPATQPVYRRAGYEGAGAFIGYKLPTARIDVRDHTLELRQADKDDAERMSRAYDVRASRTSGNLGRHDRIRDRTITWDDPATQVFLAIGDGVEGYAVVHPRSGEHGFIECSDLVVLTARAGRRLLSLFADYRSVARHVSWHGSPSDPLATLLSEQVVEVADSINWMLRIVDVRGALGSRGYADGIEAEVQLDVRDDVLPWNNGRFVLDVSGGKAKARKGGRGRLRIDVRGLAALYTGRMSAAELIATGYADGPQRELDAATAVFSGPAPWSADYF